MRRWHGARSAAARVRSLCAADARTIRPVIVTLQAPPLDAQRVSTATGSRAQRRRSQARFAVGLRAQAAARGGRRVRRSRPGTATARRPGSGRRRRRPRREAGGRTRPRRSCSAAPSDMPVAASVAGAGEHHRAQRRAAVVAVDVAAGERRQAGVAHDVAADDRAVAVAARASSRASGRPRRARCRRCAPRCPRSTASRSWRPRRARVRAPSRPPRSRPGRRRRSRGRRWPGRTRSATGCAARRPRPPAAAPARERVARRDPVRRPFGSMRRSLPSGFVGLCALSGTALLSAPPPSPVPAHSIPSGPTWSWPPLWFSAAS